MLGFGYKCTAGLTHLGVLVGEVNIGTSGAVGTNTLPECTVTKTGTGVYDVTFAGVSLFQAVMADIAGEEKVGASIDNANSKITLTTYNTSNSAADLSDQVINLLVFAKLGV